MASVVEVGSSILLKLGILLFVLAFRNLLSAPVLPLCSSSCLTNPPLASLGSRWLHSSLILQLPPNLNRSL